MAITSPNNTIDITCGNGSVTLDINPNNLPASWTLVVDVTDDGNQGTQHTITDENNVSFVTCKPGPTVDAGTATDAAAAQTSADAAAAGLVDGTVISVELPSGEIKYYEARGGVAEPTGDDDIVPVLMWCNPATGATEPIPDNAMLQGVEPEAFLASLSVGTTNLNGAALTPLLGAGNTEVRRETLTLTNPSLCRDAVWDADVRLGAPNLVSQPGWFLAAVGMVDSLPVALPAIVGTPIEYLDNRNQTGIHNVGGNSMYEHRHGITPSGATQQVDGVNEINVSATSVGNPSLRLERMSILIRMNLI